MRLTHNTLSENVRTETSELLNRHLPAAIDLHGQLKQAHWNVRGPTFIAVHELFDKVAGEAESYSDCSPSAPRALAQSRKARFRSRPSDLSLSPTRCASLTKPNTCSRSPRRLPHSGNRLAKRSNNQRRSRTLIRPIYSPRYHAASTISSGSSNRMLHRYERNVRLRENQAGNSRRLHENCDRADRDQ
jgi:hypothetical protein